MRHMKAHHFIASLLACACACQTGDQGNQAEPAASQPAEPPAPETAVISDAAPPAPAPLALVEFPHTPPGTEAGQKVFAPTDSSLVEAVDGDERRRGRLNYVIAQVTEVGDTESQVIGLGSTWTVPNAYLVPIPPPTEVAVGDLVVTSRHANDMTRAIITEAGDKPKANFMRVMPRGDHIATLTPGHYTRLAEPWQPGAPIAVRVDGGRPELATVVRVQGQRVLAAGHMGKMLAADKAAITPLPLVPEVEKGDTVWAAWDTVHFMEGTVEKVEPRLGLVHIRFKAPFDKDARPIPFGEIATGSLE
jgi:hypothetical protein